MVFDSDLIALECPHLKKIKDWMQSTGSGSMWTLESPSNDGFQHSTYI